MSHPSILGSADADDATWACTHATTTAATTTTITIGFRGAKFFGERRVGSAVTEATRQGEQRRPEFPRRCC